MARRFRRGYKAPKPEGHVHVQNNVRVTTKYANTFDEASVIRDQVLAVAAAGQVSKVVVKRKKDSRGKESFEVRVYAPKNG